MKQFTKYIGKKRKTIVAFVLSAAIFSLSFYLYNLPMLAIIYPTFLCGLIWLALMVIDYMSVEEKREALRPVKHLEYDFVEAMPAPKGPLDEDYQEIIRLLKEEHVRSMGESNARYNDMMDYYTVWAHQIKTPITAMRIKLENEDTELSRSLRLELARVESYVEMVLTYARLESKDSDYLIKKIKLDDIIRPSIRKFAGEFIERKIGLSYEAIDEEVLTDEKWLGFVIEQLISNALKYTSEGHIEIFLEEPCTLCIKDTGIGITKEDLPRIFENGYTGFNGRNDRRASGIGLYLCKRICTNLGHKLSGESTLGEGSCFRIGLGTIDRIIE